MQIERRPDGIAVITMADGHGNAVSPAFVAELDRVMTEVQADLPRALVLTGSGAAFSAGLALPVLVDYSRDELRAFMASFDTALKKLLTLPVPTVAAVNGHAIAGGCVIAVMCDRRVMAQTAATIGLTEVHLGVSLPSIVSETLKLRLAPAGVARVMLSGELFAPADAQEIGLIDEVVSPEDLLAVATASADGMVRPGDGYGRIKADLLAPALAEMQARGEDQLDGMMDTWFSAAAQEQVRAVVAHLHH
ncbi:MAG: enoyl-CoA hydratase/isomerase family protein [Actinobacteria bacterium]|nr:enoyl-CoA hydratase/isomerase family protein [Actinomycetota bacterium]